MSFCWFCHAVAQISQTKAMKLCNGALLQCKDVRACLQQVRGGSFLFSFNYLSCFTLLAETAVHGYMYNQLIICCLGRLISIQSRLRRPPVNIGRK